MPPKPGTASAATEWPALRRLVALDRRWADWAARRRSTTFLYEFLRFGVKQAWACLFGGIMVALLLGTHLWYPTHPLLYRYDFLTIAAVLVQAVMLATGLETWAEAKVILAFHVTGTVMELFKTSVGAWIYPEPSLLHWGAVPLFSGFMYASVGSYMARAWRAFDFRFSRHPPVLAVMAAGLAAYLNFFTHHFLPDVRVVLFALVALLFLRTRIFYRIDRAYRSMPLLLGLVLVSLFIWFAENSGTYARAWIYLHTSCAAGCRWGRASWAPGPC